MIIRPYGFSCSFSFLSSFFCLEFVGSICRRTIRTTGFSFSSLFLFSCLLISWVCGAVSVEELPEPLRFLLVLYLYLSFDPYWSTLSLWGSIWRWTVMSLGSFFVFFILFLVFWLPWVCGAVSVDELPEPLVFLLFFFFWFCDYLEFVG